MMADINSEQTPKQSIIAIVLFWIKLTLIDINSEQALLLTINVCYHVLKWDIAFLYVVL